MSVAFNQRTATPVAPTSPDVYYDVDTTAVVTPTDRVRWASVLAGLVTVMAALIVFTVLGIALGFAAFDSNQPNNYGLGAGLGIYGIIAGLFSFFLGGLMAARTAAVGGHSNGLLQGAVVWMLTIVLVVNLLGAGIGTLLGVTTSVANTAINAAAEVAGGAAGAVADEAVDADNAAGGAAGAVAATALPAGSDTLEAVAAQVQGAAAQVEEQIANVSAQDVEEVANNVSQGARTALLGLGLTALAAMLGGVVGARRHMTDAFEARA